MSINITEAQIQVWIQDGVKQSIQGMLRDNYGAGADLKKAMAKAVAEAEPQILAALRIGIAQACVSPAFLVTIEKEIATSLASQYRGAFDGVIRAAAKSAASNEIVARRVVELTRAAAGIDALKAADQQQAKEGEA